MSKLLTRGMAGPEVQALAQALKRELGDDAAPFAVLDAAEPSFDDNFQGATGATLADRHRHHRRRGGRPALPGPAQPDPAPGRHAWHSSSPWPRQPALSGDQAGRNIARCLPVEAAALGVFELTDRAMVPGRAGHSSAPRPKASCPSPSSTRSFNTAPGGRPSSLYDRSWAMGPRRGARYRGRGFMQLTGRANYAHYGEVSATTVATPTWPMRRGGGAAAGAYLSSHKPKQFRGGAQEPPEGCAQAGQWRLHGLRPLCQSTSSWRAGVAGSAGVAGGAGAGAGKGGHGARCGRKQAASGLAHEEGRPGPPRLASFRRRSACPNEFPPQEDIAGSSGLTGRQPDPQPGQARGVHRLRPEPA